MAGDCDAVVGTFDAVVDRSGVVGAYDVAWCLAATMVGDGVPMGAWTLDFPGIDEAAYDTRWVARFVSAYANHRRRHRRGALRRRDGGRAAAGLPADPRRLRRRDTPGAAG